MALDTKQKRGSAMELSLPFREWLANPSGSVSQASRKSMLRMVGIATSSPGSLASCNYYYRLLGGLGALLFVVFLT